MAVVEEKVVDEDEVRYQSDIKKRWWVLRKRGNLRFYWDLLIILCALYTSIMLPFSMSFDYVMDMVAEPPYIYIKHAIYGAYVLDIFLGFNTSVCDVASGDEYFSMR